MLFNLLKTTVTVKYISYSLADRMEYIEKYLVIKLYRCINS